MSITSTRASTDMDPAADGRHRRGPERSRVWRRLAGISLGLFVATATVGYAQARPDESQRLRGLADRVFLVEVAPAAMPDLTVLVNCYTFGADGTWTDPAAPVAFTWEQTRVGASTDYLVRFQGGELDGTVFQTGTVSPAGGDGVLQLSAATPATPFGPLVSNGHEVDVCPDGVPEFLLP